MTHLKLFENFKNAKTIRDLIGDFESTLLFPYKVGNYTFNKYFIKTTNGVIVNGFSSKEEFDFNLEKEIQVKDNLVYSISNKNREIGCLGIKDGDILIYSDIPGDYEGSVWKGNTFFVYGHDGREKINLDDLGESKFTDRNYLMD